MDHDESRDFTVGHHAPPHLYLRSDTTARSSGNALLPHPQLVPPPSSTTQQRPHRCVVPPTPPPLPLSPSLDRHIAGDGPGHAMSAPRTTRDKVLAIIYPVEDGH
jgi:hypothetical protein